VTVNFLEYQHQLSRLQAALQAAVERFERGEDGLEVNMDRLVTEVLQAGPDAGDQN
jgi:hypothetical protein